jgi:hypothetical protein
MGSCCLHLASAFLDLCEDLVGDVNFDVGADRIPDVVMPSVGLFLFFPGFAKLLLLFFLPF